MLLFFLFFLARLLGGLCAAVDADVDLVLGPDRHDDA